MSHHSDHEKRDRAVHLGVGLSSPLWATAWFAVGVGAAYWWWAQMGRKLVGAEAPDRLTAPLGASPEKARPTPAGQSGEAQVEVAPPELVMAHAPPPMESPGHPDHPSDEAISEPPPEMLAHAPPETLGVSFKPASGFENPTQDPDSVFEHEDTGASSGSGGEGSTRPSMHAAPAAVTEPAAGRPRLKTPVEPGAAILASPLGEPEFDADTLATETSVAALTAGEVMDEPPPHEPSLGESPPSPRARTRRKPGTGARSLS